MSRPHGTATDYHPAIVVIGGGTGSYTLLRSLKKLTPNITALVNMSDDGGSTGVLRDELGVLPPGDVRQCLVALSEAPQELRELFNFRFARGSLKGHSFGNLFLSAVEKMNDNFADAVRMASDVLRITGRVVPITLSDHHLVLVQDGMEVVGEYKICETELTGRPVLSLQPVVAINPVAYDAIVNADVIVIAPGNVYGSLAPALLVDGMRQAMTKTSAKIVYVCNLVNKSNQTPDFEVHDYALEIERFISAPVLDYVLYNVDLPSDEILKKYALSNEYPVTFSQDVLRSVHYEAIPGDFLSHAEHSRNAQDSRIVRSLIRHDAEAVTEALQTIIDNNR